MKKKKLGLGFADEVAKVTFQAGHFKNPKTDDSWKDSFLPNFDPSSESFEGSSWRTLSLIVISAVGFFALFLRLFHLQVAEGSENRQRADGNRITIQAIHAPRGVIFDRNGKILAQNEPGFRLTEGETTTFLSREKALELEIKNDPKAANLEIDSIRKYPQGAQLAHVLGYVGQISPEQLKDSDYKDYKSGDRVGLSGVEQTFEKYLKGTDGGEIIEVDAQGKKLRTLRKTLPIPGKNLYLTIDADLQHQTFVALSEAVKKAGSCCGAAILADPKSGEILSLVSVPSFDNNQFSDPQRSGVEAVLSDPNSPALNRAIGGTYPPGSTFKIISSLAALASGKITPTTIFEDTGQIFLGPFKFTNWYFTQYGKVEGSVDLVKALQRSNDTYYYRVGELIGEKALIEWSRKLHLGSKLGIDLPGEVSGLVPDNDWKQKTTDQPWYPGDTLHMAIGQGFLLTTPLQVLGFTSFIAADGNLYRPKIGLKIADPESKSEDYLSANVLISNLISRQQLEVIKKGLRQVTASGGTAWPFFNFPIETSGKTGTAEYGDPKDRTHAWYSAFAPSSDPKIVATVLIEGGGEGSTVASPVVKQIFSWYFAEDKTNPIKDLAPVATESARTLGE